MPYSFKAEGRPYDDWQFEFITRTGTVRSVQTTAGASGDITTQTDTELSGTVTYKGLDGIEPYFALALNLPTGKSALTGTQPFARMDPDLVGVATFGEGFNVGPTLGVTITFNADLVAGFSVGYNNRGSYNRDGLTNTATGGPPPGVPATGISSLNPGDITTLASSVAYRWNSWTFRSSASYSFEQQTNVNGGPFYKTGDRFFITGSATYDWPNAWYTTISSYYAHNNKNNVLNTLFFSPLVLEALNTNNDAEQIALDHRFKWDAWSFGPTASYLHRNHNSWSPLLFQFVPAKSRWSAGGGAEYAFNKQLTLNTRLEGVWLSQAIDPALGVPAFSSTGIMFSAGGTYTF